ncbi:MAG: transketolase [candidate division Zixibacteria bacterium]|nr:transketolase [candidate division Zixibacteria bacterium]
MNPFSYDLEQLKQKTLDIRRDIITMLVEAKSGHCGGPLSCTDFATALYFNYINHNPDNPDDPDRDVVVYSIGHVTPVNYSILAECGYFPLRDLMKFRKIDGHLQGHPNKLDTPGIEASTGSLGQGISISVGIASAFRMDSKPNRAYCICGDGEHQEGSIWEAVMAAGNFALDNICVILDLNNAQIDGRMEDIMDINPITDKYRAFKWNVIEIDGHDLQQVLGALDEAKTVKGKPTVIIAKTVMGKGVSFMEGDYKWHGMPPDREQGERALHELGTTYDEWSQRLLSS